MQRDAIHVPTLAMVSTCYLVPGQIVDIDDGGEINLNVKRRDAVVDPFMAVPVVPGQVVMLWIKPGTITELRHTWKHEVFDSGDSVEWMKKFAAENEISYEMLMDDVRRYIIHEEWTGNNQLCDAVNEVHNEFWKHVQAITGMSASGSPYSCAC